jgi:hypothetical protein
MEEHTVPTTVIKTVPERSALMRLMPPTYFTDHVFPQLRVLVAEACSADYKLDPVTHIGFETPVLNPLYTQLSSPIEINIVTIGYESRVKKLTDNDSIVQKELSAAILRVLYMGAMSHPVWVTLAAHEQQAVINEHAAYATGELQLVWFVFTDPRGLHV